MTSQSLVGAIGVVASRVRGGAQAGEVRVVVEGLPHYYLAFCPNPLDVGRHVVVIHNRGSRQVDVEALPMADHDLEYGGGDAAPPHTERN